MERLTMYTPDGYESINPIDLVPNEYSKINYEKLLTKLGDYEDAEEQGLLLRLPCKVGDTVWWINAFGELKHSEVNSIFIEQGIGGIVIETLICNIYGEDIGKTVFLTKEEAEQVLKQIGE